MQRGFLDREFQKRVSLAQNLMAKNNFAQALVMQESPTMTLSLLPLDDNTVKMTCCTEN